MGFLDDWAKKAEEERATAGVGDVADLSREERGKALQTAADHLVEDLTDEIEAVLKDVLLPDESIIYKIRSSLTGDRSQLP